MEDGERARALFVRKLVDSCIKLFYLNYGIADGKVANDFMQKLLKKSSHVFQLFLKMNLDKIIICFSLKFRLRIHCVGPPSLCRHHDKSSKNHCFNLHAQKEEWSWSMIGRTTIYVIVFVATFCTHMNMENWYDPNRKNYIENPPEAVATE